MTQDPQAALRELDGIADRLNRFNTVHWVNGTCQYPSRKETGDGYCGRCCDGDGHPNDCDGAMEQGSYEAFPDRPTVKMVADALVTARADIGEALLTVTRLMESQQRQLQALSTKHGAHRHKIGEGHFSDRPDT